MEGSNLRLAIPFSEVHTVYFGAGLAQNQYDEDSTMQETTPLQRAAAASRGQMPQRTRRPWARGMTGATSTRSIIMRLRMVACGVAVSGAAVAVSGQQTSEAASCRHGGHHDRNSSS
jgi:hypothetical protein